MNPLLFNDLEFDSVASNQIDFQALSKAMLAPETVSDLYGIGGAGVGTAGAITMQSLEGILHTLMMDAQDYTFYQDIEKQKAFSTIEEYARQVGLGASESSFVNQEENPDFYDPAIDKPVAYVKFLSEGWKVLDVQEATNTISSARAIQQKAALDRLLRNLNRGFYSADSNMIPEAFNGIAATIRSDGSATDQIFDMRGGSLNNGVFNSAGQLITNANVSVEGARLYCSSAGLGALAGIAETTSATGNYNRFINSGDKGVYLGQEIKGIRTNYGSINHRMDITLGMEFEGKILPQTYNPVTKVWTEGATSAKAPSVPTFTAVVAAGVSGSKFQASGVRPSGVNMSYRICSRNKYGRSIAAASVTTAAVVATGGGVTITITPNADASGGGNKTPMCYEIFGEKVSGSGVFQYLTTVKANGTTPVVYVDTNYYIPGTSRMYIVPQNTPAKKVVAFSQLLPVHNTDLAKDARTSRGLVNLYGVPKWYRPNALVEIINIEVNQVANNKLNFI